MKPINKILLTLCAILLLSFTISKSNSFFEEYENVGTVKQSILKPIQFNKTQKGTWVELKGQQLSQDSELFKLLEENSDLNILTKKENQFFLPDARGAFIRSSNINGVGLDPEENRLVGSIQNDTIMSHNHSSGTVTRELSGNNPYGTASRGGSAWEHHKHQGLIPNTSMTGDVETRPVNISMFTYIKIAK